MFGGRQIVEWQRIRVAHVEGDAAKASELLRLFEQSQMIFEDDLATANRPTASALLRPGWPITSAARVMWSGQPRLKV
jgi:hypothetical protein